MMKRRFPFWFVPIMALALTSLHACGEVDITDRDYTIDATGTIAGSAYLDIDGNGTRTAVDAALPGLNLQLLSASNGSVVRTATTDAMGEFLLVTVPTGSFRLALDPLTAPDSLLFSGLESENIVLLADSVRQAVVRASFPNYSLAEVRDLAPGIRVITQGIALNARRPDGDGVVHLREGSVYLRSVNVDRENIQTGDSVRFIGRTARDAGLPILDDVRPFRLIPQAVFVQPIDVTSGEAASAGAGELDAGLVRVRDAFIEDTMTVGTDFIVRANDGSGPVEIVFRKYIFPDFSVDPDLALLGEVTGLLVPLQVGPDAVRWRMTPRVPADVVVEPLPPVPVSRP